MSSKKKEYLEQKPGSQFELINASCCGRAIRALLIPRAGSGRER